MRKRRRLLIVLTFAITLSLAPIGLLYFSLNSNTKDDEIVKLDIKPSPVYSRADQKCALMDSDTAESYPACSQKINWLMGNWKKHECYRQNGVNGSLCSFRKYLSNVEAYCPPIDEEKPLWLEDIARMNSNIQQLFAEMNDSVDNYDVIKTRISKLWSHWEYAYLENMKSYPNTMKNRQRKNILIFIGLLAKEEKLKFISKSKKGGPLGELIQWSDLMASLFILGHNLTISTKITSLKKTLAEIDSNGPCEYIDGKRNRLDLVFTDIMGFNMIKRINRSPTIAHCRFRLVDSFGTHAEFATKSYYYKHKDELGGKTSHGNAWGGHGLQLAQHWTFYPHSHDNTFLGFVVEPSNHTQSDKQIALVYGKERYMWMSVIDSIRVLQDYYHVVATIGDDDPPIDNIENLGFLTADEYKKLLGKVRVFFGLGFPLEGPAPMEAIANGAIFVNHRFREPKSRRNYEFLADKPTLREWNSQCPYLENIGEPNVMTVDVTNEKELREVLQRSKGLKPKPLIPAEFTTNGMLLRIARLIEKQNYCEATSDDKMWPPIDALRIIKGDDGDSCEIACQKKQLVCEPAFFHIVNRNEVITRNFDDCQHPEYEQNPLAPHDCVAQSGFNLFSCASKPTSPGIRRLCPCRDTLHGQHHALCSICV